MFGSDIIETAIGLALVYVLFSALCSALNEWIVGHILNLRAATLEKAIGRMLAGSETAKQFFNLPLIKTLADDDQAKPSYLSSALFTDALLGLVKEQAGKGRIPADADTLRKLAGDLPELLRALEKLENKDLQAVLQAVLAGTKNMEEARAKIEFWFNEGMDRATGWYRKHVQIAMALLALGVAAVFNVDSFTISRELMNNSKLRATLVAAAAETVKQPASTVTNAQEKIEAIEAKIKKLDLPLGWTRRTITVQRADGTTETQTLWLRPGERKSMKIAGLLVTAGALSLGAPFWFDLLGKIMNLRATGRKPEERDKGKAAKSEPPSDNR